MRGPVGSHLTGDTTKGAILARVSAVACDECGTYSVTGQRKRLPEGWYSLSLRMEGAATILSAFYCSDDCLHGALSNTDNLLDACTLEVTE